MVSPAPPVTPSVRILVVDDDPVAAAALADQLRRDGHHPATAHNPDTAIEQLDQARPPFALLITDLNMPGVDGLDLIRRLRRTHRSLVPIVVTGYGRLDTAVRALRLGAIDFLTKPLVPDDLRRAVDRAIDQHTLLAAADPTGTPRHQPTALLGGHQLLQRAADRLATLGPTAHPVLICGEPGVGKDSLAVAIHRIASSATAARGDRPGPLIRHELGNHDPLRDEAELFGHLGRAYPGARTRSDGKIAEATRGTLLISRLDRATPGQQAALARLAAHHTYRPLGADHDLPATARLIFTTCTDPARLTRDGFRADLLDRLSPGQITLPPLRQRPDDLPALADHLLTRLGAEHRRTRRLGHDTLALLRRHPWPGNLRELEHTLQHAVVHSRQPVISPDDLPDTLTAPAPAPAHPLPTTADSPHIPALASGWTPTPLHTALAQCERRILLAALQANHWNRSETARQLNINRVTLYKKIRAHHLDQPHLTPQPPQPH